MRKVKSLVVLLMVIIGLFVSVNPVVAAVKVRGYYRKNGTYVQPYRRSNSNWTRYDNYSTKGNINPYTGKKGTKNIYPKTIRTRNLRTRF
jgi:hypothetical protein